MKKHLSRRRFVETTAAVSLGVAAVLSGCLGDDEAEVPDADFVIENRDDIEIEMGDGETREGSELTVRHSGDPLTIENTHSLELRPEEGTQFDAWVPTEENPIEENTETFQVGDEVVAPGETVVFVWIDPDGEQEAELDRQTLPG